MKLVRIELYHVRMNLKDAFETSFGRKSELNHLIIKLYDESGAIGWGETASPSKPDYCPETLETCLHMQRDFLIPAILGKSFDTVEEFTGFYEWVRGNNFAKAGLEMAVWDLLAKSRGISLSKMLGGTRPYIESGVSLGIEPDINTLLSKIEKYLAEGYKRIKLKIKPGRDLTVLAEVRRHYPDVPLTADANSAYTLKDIAHLKQFDRFNLAMIEQPLAYDDIVDHALLQRELETPVCLDESIHSVENARHALELGSCRVINIKPGRVGGLLEARKIHDVCQQYDVPVWCGGMHEYGIGRAHNVALCSLPNFSMPGDVSGSDKYFEEDLTQPRVLAPNGRITVPTDNPGIGYEVNEETLKRHLAGTYNFT